MRDYRFDNATQLYYLMVRYYNPEIKRFITKDTFHDFESDPKSLNLYAYAENNPIRYIDPTGHSITDLAKKAGYNAFFWAIKSLYEGIVLYFWNRPSGLDWGLWAMKTVITGQAAIISSQFGPWTAGIITTAALIGSDLLARTVKSYANYIKNRSANRSTIAYWAARDVTNYLFF